MEKFKKVVCRICEEEIVLSLLREHSKFCVIANTWDMIARSSEDQLHKVASELNEKIHNSTDELTRARVDEGLLGTLKRIATRYALN
jgi:hypothetical protein